MNFNKNLRQISAILVSALFLLSSIPSASLAENTDYVNLFTSKLASSQGILMDVGSGTVSYDTRFNQNGALAAGVDGNTTTATDVYGALDWEYPKYVGAVYTLDDTYYCDRTVIYSGFDSAPDTYKVFASDSLSNLYTTANLVAENIVCKDGAQSIIIGKNVKYIAYLCTAYNGNQRVKEFELWGAAGTVNTGITGIYQQGNSLYDSDGNAVTLKGVNITELSFSVFGDGSTQPGQSDAHKSFNTVVEGWNCNAIRLAVNPEYYLRGGISKGVTRTAEEYRALVDSFVTAATQRGIFTILDCHGYYGVTPDIISFWNIVAPLYNNNDLVLYGLLNEPVSDWTIFYEGGTLSINGTNTTVYGLPYLLDRVRAVSDNVVVIGGVDWAFDLSYVTSERLAEYAETRTAATGKTVDQYLSDYYLATNARKGNGIVFDTHIYSSKHSDWLDYLDGTIAQFPVLVGELGPTYLENAPIVNLTAQEKGYLIKIFNFISHYNLSYTAWGINAWPFLSTSSNGITPYGEAVKEFMASGNYGEDCITNLLYTNSFEVTPVAMPKSGGAVFDSNMFYNQAAGQGGWILDRILDSDTTAHYDVYPLDDYYAGLRFALDRAHNCTNIKITSGLSAYPDKYIVYASNDLADLYNQSSIVENRSISFTGDTVSITINRPVKYFAFFADGYVRIKEVELYEYQPVLVGNLLQTHLANATGILFNTEDNTVTLNNKFNDNGALTAAVDTDRILHTDFYGWTPTVKVGARYDLDAAYYCDNITIYSGFPTLPDTYRVYASNQLSDLYNAENMIADNLFNTGSAVTISPNKNIQYIAFISMGDGGRVREFEVYNGIRCYHKSFLSATINGTSISYTCTDCKESVFKTIDGDTLTLDLLTIPNKNHYGYKVLLGEEQLFLATNTPYTCVGNEKISVLAGIAGDADLDGSINVSDLLVFRKYLLTDTTDLFTFVSDTNSDSVINIKDLVRIKKMIAV